MPNVILDSSAEEWDPRGLMPTALNPSTYSVEGDGEFLVVASYPDKENKAKEREGAVGKRRVGNASWIALVVEFDVSGWP